MLPFVAVTLTIMQSEPPDADWLIEPKPFRSEIVRDGATITLQNGLVRRKFATKPTWVCTALDNLTTHSAMLRSIRPEATLQVAGKQYEIGGTLPLEEQAYMLASWLTDLKPNPEAFQLDSIRTGKPRAHIPWVKNRWSATQPWPPPGVALIATFRPPPTAVADVASLLVDVHYELYDGIPAMCKWIEIRNVGTRPVVLERYESEVLALVEYETSVEARNDMRRPLIHVQTDYSFGGFTQEYADNSTIWEPDPLFTSQICYERTAPVLLKSRPLIGPAAQIPPGGKFVSHRTYELLLDTDERERRGLAIRRLHRTVAPWITENPILMHIRNSDSESIRRAVDQCAEVGFEMAILTFGSGFNIESEDPGYIAKVKADFDYARSKGIEIGAYTLTASRDAGKGNNVEALDTPNPKTGRKGATFGQSPCLASAWSDGYYDRLRRFIEATNLMVIEDDGSYPGDICAATNHAHHRGVNDSQWSQWKAITGFYQWARSRGIFIHAPDYYYLAGTNRSGMGYRETNWSLPRDRQILLGRQNIYDGTWEKTPSMGWMFVPLVEYHGGGAAATLEPLSEHLDAYEAHLAQNFGNGVQACYRGPRLFDTDATKAVVKKWVDFYKRYREVLDGDIVHVRRPDGRNLDCMLHVNPGAKVCGLAMVYNPTSEMRSEQMQIPLYYTGLRSRCRITVGSAKPRVIELDDRQRAAVKVAIPPHSHVAIVFDRV